MKIEIVGLCLLALEEDRMHLLLPSTAPPCFAHDLPHRAVLGISDRADPAPEDYVEFPLEGVDFDLSCIGGSRFEKPRLKEVADMSALTGEPLDPRLLNDPHPQCVRSRVRIASGHAVPVPAEAEWLIPGHGSPVPLTHRLKWVIGEVCIGELREYLVASFSGLTVPAIPGGRSLHLRIRHVPYEENPRRDLVLNESAGHFAAYYGLFDGARELVVPAFYRRRQNTGIASEKRSVKAGQGMVFTCMLAQAPVG